MYTDFQNMYTISYIQCTQLLSLYKILYIQLYNFSTKKKKKKTHTHTQFYKFNICNFLNNVHNSIYSMYTNFQAKMGICPFRPKQVAKCPYSETIKQNASILKLNF